MKNKVIYVGNILSKHGYTQTNIETLGKQLSQYYTIISTSDKKSYLYRVVDSISTICKHRKECKLVLIDTYSTKNFYYSCLSAILCKLFKLEYIPILHGGNLPQRLDKYPWICKRYFHNSKINISPSGYLEYEFKKRGYRTSIIYNNITIKDYKFKLRSDYSPKILWVRSFAEIYNCKMAVNVLAKLKLKFPKAELCMVGPDKDGSMETTLELARQLNISESVLVTGKLLKKEWHILSESYDIFINTTNFDNTPVSIIEAMALGLPVVSTNVGGLPYLINNTIDGLLVNPNDAIAMANNIELLINNPALGQKIALQARKKIEDMDWEQVKYKWFNILK